MVGVEMISIIEFKLHLQLEALLYRSRNIVDPMRIATRW
jgi:hypothetical protein